MSDRFVTILERCYVALKPSTVESRSAGTDAAVDALAVSDLPGVATLAFGGAPSDEALRDRFSDHFRRVDPTFAPETHGEELGVLAALTLDRYLAEPSCMSDVAALSIATRSLRRQASPRNAIEVLDAAEAYLADRALAIRRVRPISSVLGDPTAKSAQTKTRRAAASAISDAESGLDVESVESLVKGAADQVSSEVDALGTSVDLALRTVVRMLSIQSEEINVLWWATNAYCNTLGTPISELDVVTAALPVAQDLLELASLTPGPFAAEALLRRVLHSASGSPAESASVPAVVNETQEDWRNALLGSASSVAMSPNDSTPILHALQATTAVADAAAWPSVYEKSSGFDPGVELPIEQISYQFFLELSLARAIAASSADGAKA